MTKSYGTKSFVTLTTLRCPVCSKEEENGDLLLDQRLRETFEHYTCVGMGLCHLHKKAGFTCLISAKMEGQAYKGEEQAYHRDGRIAYVRNEVWPNVGFKVPLPPDGWTFVSPEVMDLLQKAPGATNLDEGQENKIV